VGALLIALRSAWRAGAAIGAVASVLAAGLLSFGDDGWRHVMSSGIFRIQENIFEPRLMAFRKEHMKILFYEDAADATVSVEQVDGKIAPPSIGLRINGKPDAGTSVDLCTQMLVAHLPMLVRPGARDVFMLGVGSGISAGALLAYPVDQIVIAENCEPVIRAADIFSDWNRNVLKDPRVRVWVEDARTALKLRPQLYDVIITQPSNPWTVGVGSVFSREYYELAASRLKSGGVVANWFHIYETDDEVVGLVLRTFSSVFPYVEIWDTGQGDIVMLGSLLPWQTGPEVFRQSFAMDRVAKDMAMIDIHSPEGLLARQLASQRTAFAIAGDGPIQSDLFPMLEYKAPQAFYLSGRASLLDRFDERTHKQLLAPPEKNAALANLPTTAVQLMLSTFSTMNGEFYGCLFGAPASASVPCVFQTPEAHPSPPTDGTVLNLCSAAIARGDLFQADQLAAYALQQQPSNIDAAYLARVIARARELKSR
jgi:hypothetical protein